jgi:lysophospholipase L1-like esterase
MERMFAMSLNKPIKIKRGSSWRRWTVPLIAVGCIALVSLGVALVWQSLTIHVDGPAPIAPSAPEIPPSQYEAPEVPSQPSQSAEPSPAPDVPEPPAPSELSDYFGIVFPETERVTSDYFKDAVFIGDSLTMGIQLYDIMEGATVLSATGINLSSINTAQVIDAGDGTKITVLDALARNSYGKIYIMMGANGVGYLSEEQTLTLYGAFIDEVRALCPDSVIYIQSVLPICEEKYAQRYKAVMNNADIDALNARLVELAAEKRCLYLDVASAFKDERGHMPESATPDGIHLYSSGYTTWFDYLKTHAYVEAA